MKKHWLWLLSMELVACGQPLEIAPSVALKHQHDASFQRQVHLLQAEQVRVSATAPGAAGPAVLTLEVINPRNQPAHPDTLKLRIHKLAHLLVADLASPAQYQIVNAQATFKYGIFPLSSTSSAQAFIYPAASLR